MLNQQEIFLTSVMNLTEENLFTNYNCKMYVWLALHIVFVNKLNFYKSGNMLSFRSPVYIIEQKWLPRMEFDHLHLEKSKTVNYFMKSNSVNVAFVI